MSDPVEIMNRFTEYSPSKGEDPLPLPIPGHWFRKICGLAERCAKAENQLAEAKNSGLQLSRQQLEYVFDLVLNEHKSWLMMDAQSKHLMDKRAEMIPFTEQLLDAISHPLNEVKHE